MHTNLHQVMSQAEACSQHANMQHSYHCVASVTVLELVCINHSTCRLLKLQSRLRDARLSSHRSKLCLEATNNKNVQVRCALALRTRSKHLEGWLSKMHLFSAQPLQLLGSLQHTKQSWQMLLQLVLPRQLFLSSKLAKLAKPGLQWRHA